jgi:L-threonylcarbamoyladenylate synthase
MIWFIFRSDLEMDSDDVVSSLGGGGIGVLPTDTLYGLVGSALSLDTIQRIYGIKGRQTFKPFIVLIADVADLEKFGVSLDEKLEGVLASVWPGPVSVILHCGEGFEYLHRGTGGIAFRLPNRDDLRRLLRKVGPLVAPSANTEGGEPAKTIAEAKNYFGDKVDFYVDDGELLGEPSTLAMWAEGKLQIIRQGVGKINL